MTLLEDRRTFPTAGGTVVYAPDSLGRSYRAIRTDGVPLGRFRTFEDADAVLLAQLAPDAPLAPAVARCRHCRSAEHATESCPVEAAAAKRREQMRGKRERSKGDGSNRESGGQGAGGRSGLAEAAHLDGGLDAHGGNGAGGGGDDPSEVRDVGGWRTGCAAPGDATAGDREPSCAAGCGCEGEEGAPMTSRTDDIPDLTADPHTLDEYARALAFAAEKRPCKAEDVRRVVWGSKGGRDATEWSLDELERQGRADKVFGGRWKPRAAMVPLVPGAMFSPRVSNAPLTVEERGERRDVAPVVGTRIALDDRTTATVLAVGDAPDGSPWVETPVEPDTGAGTDVPDLLVGGIPVRWGTTEVKDPEPSPAIDLSGLTGTARGTAAPDDPDAEVEPTEGDGEEPDSDEGPPGITIGDVVRAADAAGLSVEFSFPKKPRTIDDIAAKYAGPVYEVRRAHELVTGLPARRERLAKAIEELEAAAATGRGMLVDLDRMIGGSK